MLDRLLVLGSGLIGGSLAQAACNSSEIRRVTVMNRSAATNQRALELGIANDCRTYDELTQTLTELSAGDLVVVAVPVKTYPRIFSMIAGHLPAGVLLTDVGSTKVSVIEAAHAQWPEPCFFIPGHPIAGSEQTGVEAANSSLFVNRRTILTPLDCNSNVDVEIVADLWRAIGANVDVMQPRNHDLILGATSHLPHLLAFALVDALSRLDQKSEIFRYAAGGFRDFTRIAESDPEMWRDIFLSNSAALLEQLDHFDDHLKLLRSAIEKADGREIETILERAQRARRHYREDREADQAG